MTRSAVAMGKRAEVEGGWSGGVEGVEEWRSGGVEGWR